MESWSKKRSKKSVILRRLWYDITPPRHHPLLIITDGGDGRLYPTFPFTMGDLTAMGITGIDPTPTGDLGTIPS
jgi:hypothetical protein